MPDPKSSFTPHAALYLLQGMSDSRLAAIDRFLSAVSMSNSRFTGLPGVTRWGPETFEVELPAEHPTERFVIELVGLSRKSISNVVVTAAGPTGPRDDQAAPKRTPYTVSFTMDAAEQLSKLAPADHEAVVDVCVGTLSHAPGHLHDPYTIDQGLDRHLMLHGASGTSIGYEVPPLSHHVIITAIRPLPPRILDAFNARRAEA
jgi:hypothetical protein